MIDIIRRGEWLGRRTDRPLTLNASRGNRGRNRSIREWIFERGLDPIPQRSIALPMLRHSRRDGDGIVDLVAARDVALTRANDATT